MRNCQRADGDGAVRSADKRVDVERLDVLAGLDGQLGHPRDRPGHRVEVGWPRPPDPGQQLNQHPPAPTTTSGPSSGSDTMPSASSVAAGTV